MACPSQQIKMTPRGFGMGHLTPFLNHEALSHCGSAWSHGPEIWFMASESIISFNQCIKKT